MIKNLKKNAKNLFSHHIKKKIGLLGYNLDLELSKEAMHGPSGCGKSKKWEASEGLILPFLCKEFS